MGRKMWKSIRNNWVFSNFDWQFERTWRNFGWNKKWPWWINWNLEDTAERLNELVNNMEEREEELNDIIDSLENHQDEFGGLIKIRF